jgi:D-alanine--poly(phosphoribitol) ligase subunit 1
MFCDHFNALMSRLGTDKETAALINGKTELSYYTLGRRVAALARKCVELRAEGPVLIRGHKETDVIAIMIASTIAGRGFVFAEAGYPATRVQQIIDTCGCVLVMNTTPSGDIYTIPQVETTAVIDEDFRFSPLDAAGEVSLFYITFTSGSTGQPKGIPITRRNFSSFLDWMKPHVDDSIGGSDACINHASMAFDMSMSDLWLALFSGRASYLLDHRNNSNPQANVSLLRRNRAWPPGTLMSTPAFIAIMLESQNFRAQHLPKLKSFWIGGEKVPKPLLKRLREAFPDAEIYHAYGPSEVTCVTHCFALSDADLENEDLLPLGSAHGNNVVAVDVGDGTLRSSGEGEIVLAGGRSPAVTCPDPIPTISILPYTVTIKAIIPATWARSPKVAI